MHLSELITRGGLQSLTHGEPERSQAKLVWLYELSSSFMKSGLMNSSSLDKSSLNEPN